jgi:hypothetical protein
VAPSAVKPAGHVSLVRPKQEFVTPRALETEEIPGIVAAYRLGAENAKKRASTAWKSTAPTATCSTSSCKTAPTSAPTTTAAPLKTAPA